jgi:hypothetical protein
MQFLRRVGSFFMLLGAGLMLLFLYSDIAHSPQPGMLVLGGFSFLGGMLLRLSNPAPPPPSSGRFGAFRKGGRAPGSQQPQGISGPPKIGGPKPGPEGAGPKGGPPPKGGAPSGPPKKKGLFGGFNK